MTDESIVPDDRTQALLRGLRNSGLTVMCHGVDLGLRLLENPPEDWPDEETVLAEGDWAIFDAATAERIQETKRGVLDTGESARMEVAQRNPSRETRWYELHIEADRGARTNQPPVDDATLPVRGLYVSLKDITDLKNREDTLQTLLYEVSHRSRNLLAIVQSVLGHTARGSDNVAVFERKFRGRIAALAHSQDLITRSNWQGTRLHRLAIDQLSDHLRPGVTPPALIGSDLVIGPNSALHLGLALHELAANSASFGVLRNGKGEITIETTQDSDRQSMIWTEHLEDSVDSTPGSGFGRAILCQIVPRAVNGQFNFEILPNAVTYRINWPKESRG